MPEARPKLALLGSEAAPAQRTSSAPERSGPQPRRWGLLVLAAALLLSLAALTVQTRRSALLSERVDGLADELSTSRLALQAQRSHLDDVRVSVAELQALVNSDPSPPAPPQPR